MVTYKSMQIDEVLARLSYLANSADASDSREFYFNLIGKLSEFKTKTFINKKGEKIKMYYDTFGEVVKSKSDACNMKLCECNMDIAKFSNIYNTIDEIELNKLPAEVRYVEEYKIFTELRDEKVTHRNFLAHRIKINDSLKDIEILKDIANHVGCHAEILLCDELCDTASGVLFKNELCTNLSKKYSDPKSPVDSNQDLVSTACKC